jgi:hypothetical protein
MKRRINFLDIATGLLKLNAIAWCVQETKDLEDFYI